MDSEWHLEPPQAFTGLLGLFYEGTGHMKRIAVVHMSWEVLATCLSSRRDTLSNFPGDAAVQYVVVDDRTRSLRVYVTSMSFAPVPEGGQIPEFEVLLREAAPA